MFAWRNVSSISLCYETRSELGYMGEIGHYLHVNARNVRLNDPDFVYWDERLIKGFKQTVYH